MGSREHLKKNVDRDDITHTFISLAPNQRNTAKTFYCVYVPTFHRSIIQHTSDSSRTKYTCSLSLSLQFCLTVRLFHAKGSDSFFFFFFFWWASCALNQLYSDALPECDTQEEIRVNGPHVSRLFSESKPTRLSSMSEFRF